MARALASVPTSLSPEEWRLVSALREVPSDALRARLTAVTARLAEFACDPRCAEMQADGVPCQDTSTACEDCQEIAALLQGIERRTGRG
jgi:hypothetical protein